MAVETLSLEPRTSVPSGTWIEVDLDRIQRNLARLREKARPETQVMAVVKSNAYGHGLVGVSKALEGKVDFLGIGSLREACLLRDEGVMARLFLFGRIFPEEVPLALQMNLTLTVSSFEEAQMISEAATRLGNPATIHVKVDTGMGRLGIRYGRAFLEIRRILGLPSLCVEGIYTHFPTAEKLADSFGEKQLKLFETLLESFERKGIEFPFRHAANSAGTIRFRSPGLNLVRPGIALYGIYPDSAFEKEIQLEPALWLKSRIVFLKRLSRGDSVSYGREFIAENPTVIGVLPVGYAHGYPFHLSGKGEVLHLGRRVPVAGRICMDWTLLDLGLETPARIGDEVILLGSDGGNEIRAEELARLTHTIPYEIVTRLESGLPRVYKGLPSSVVSLQSSAGSEVRNN